MARATAIREAAAAVANLDAIAALAEVGRRDGWVRPQVDDSVVLEIRGGRHPVVEPLLCAGGGEFVPNDADLDSAGNQILVLTGPNMSGKSTYLRQVALTVLLAQMGSFVPADSARVGIVDRVFTRVGASDRLARGESTFMVEMRETAEILANATRRSLVILDEIGRGTSTYDGVSIAWAVTEHLHEKIGAKTIFATHYHELTQLGDLLPGVVNMNVSVREVGEEIVFLRRLEEGGADRSYGIQVARLAGLPGEVIARARELLTELEGTHTSGGEGLGRFGAHRPASAPSLDQLSFFAAGDPPWLKQLRAIDPETMTPKGALELLFDLHEKSLSAEDG